MVSALKFYPNLLHGLNQIILPYYRLQFPYIIDPTSPYYILASNRSAELRSYQDETTIFMTASRLREAMETGTPQQVLFNNTSPGYQACLAELLQVVSIMHVDCYGPCTQPQNVHIDRFWMMPQ